MLASGFKHIVRKLRGEDQPRQRGIWDYDQKPILAATRDGDLKELERFLNKYEVQSIVEVCRSVGTGTTILHRAAAKGDTGVMGLLLDYGAKIHEKDAWGTTPLHVAAAEGQKDMIAFLLGRGAAINKQDAAGWTPLAGAAFKGHKETVELLLDRGAKIDAVNVGGRTALHKAVGHPSTLKLLIQRGANIDIQDSGGATPLIAACEMPAESVCLRSIAVLLEQGARLDLANNEDKTARMIAEERGAADVVELITQEEARRRENQVKLPHDVRVHRIRLKRKEARS